MLSSFSRSKSWCMLKKFPMNRPRPCYSTSDFFLSQEKNQDIWDFMKSRYTAPGPCCWSGSWPAGLTLTFHLLLRSPSMAGSAGHTDVIPVDVLEKHLSIPPRQGAGLRETKVWSPTRKVWSNRYMGSQILKKELLEPWVSQGHFWFVDAPILMICRRLMLLLSKELLPVPLSFPSQIKIRNQPSFDCYMLSWYY